MTVLLVCGAPRSSTTWMHNVLIETGNYSGKIAVDTEFVDYSDERNLYTDEDRRLTFYGVHSKHSLFKFYFKDKFKTRLKKLEAAYQKNGNLLLESPYFSFTVDLFQEIFGNELRVLHVRRRWQDVVASMVNHPHLKLQLMRSLRKSFDFHGNFFSPVELKYAKNDVLDFVRINYNALSVFDRAAFKRHCFINAYRCLSRESQCATYEFNSSNPTAVNFLELADFCGLTIDDAKAIERKHKSRPYQNPVLNERLVRLLDSDDMPSTLLR